MYISEKLAPPNIDIATEIASISVSVVNLLLLPVSGTVSISDLYLMPFPKSDDVGTGGSRSGMTENCVVAADITLISLAFTNL